MLRITCRTTDGHLETAAGMTSRLENENAAERRGQRSHAERGNEGTGPAWDHPQRRVGVSWLLTAIGSRPESGGRSPRGIIFTMWIVPERVATASKARSRA